MTLRQARTYNQSHIARPRGAGRRISIYWTWSYPWEAQRDPAAVANRFSTLTEVRNVIWPAYETPEFDAANFLQGVAGTLELFHRSALSFQELAGEATGHPVAVFQRVGQAGYRAGSSARRARGRQRRGRGHRGLVTPTGHLPAAGTTP